MAEYYSTLTQEVLKSVLSYDANTGDFTWVKKHCRKVVVGSKAGSITGQGYVEIAFLNMRFLGHRLAWFYANGHWPVNVIDHIDGVRTNNRLKNLRDVSYTENNQNMRQCRGQNTSTFLGVTALKKGWKARIKAGNRQIHLGTFETPELAHAAYIAAKQELHISQ